MIVSSNVTVFQLLSVQPLAPFLFSISMCQGTVKMYELKQGLSASPFKETWKKGEPVKFGEEVVLLTQ